MAEVEEEMKAALAQWRTQQDRMNPNVVEDVVTRLMRSYATAAVGRTSDQRAAVGVGVVRAIVIAGPLPIVRGSGSPARVLALVER